MEHKRNLDVLAALDRIVASSPALTQRWREEWGEDPFEDRLAYVECGTIAQYLIELAAIDPPPWDLAVIVEYIEREYQTTDAKVLNWLQVGLLESIQHVASNTHREAEQPLTAGEVKAHLGPLAQRSWEALDDAWGDSVDDV